MMLSGCKVSFFSEFISGAVLIREESGGGGCASTPLPLFSHRASPLLALLLPGCASRNLLPSLPPRLTLSGEAHAIRCQLSCSGRSITPALRGNMSVGEGALSHQRSLLMRPHTHLSGEEVGPGRRLQLPDNLLFFPQ